MRQDIASLLSWHSANKRNFPWRDPKVGPFHVLIAETLLRRTAANRVAPVFQTIVANYPRPEDLSRARMSELKRVLYPLGLSSRAAHLKILGAEIEERGRVPTEVTELVELPLVGDYTARAVLLTLGSGHQIPIDANILRIVRRVWGGRPLSFYDAQLNHWGKDAQRDTFFALLDLGALICRPIRPKCSVCPLSDYCIYARSNARLD